MNRLFAIFLFLLPFIQCFSQNRKEQYPSKQEALYSMGHPYQEFKPTEVSIIKNLKYDYLTVKKEDTQNKFISVWEHYASERYFDSLENISKSDFERNYPLNPRSKWSLEKYMKWEDSLTKAGITGVYEREKEEYEKGQQKFFKHLDSIRDLKGQIKIGHVSRSQVIRYDSLNKKRILFYQDYDFTEFDPGFWVAVSSDRGKTWNKYFTGLVKNNFYSAKPNSKVKFVKNDSIIQLEIAIVRMTKPWGRPLGLPKYELIEDNIVIELNLNRMMKDSDQDGLTDIMEGVLDTNASLKDTDGDGIDDPIDSNPRFKSTKNKYSNLFKYLIENGGKDSTFIPFGNYGIKEKEQTQRTDFIITDDVNLQSLGNTRNKCIFLSSQEFESYQRRNFGSLRRTYVSPMFKVDGKPSTWKIHISYGFAGRDYLIIEKKNGWLVKVIGSWIT